MPLRRTECLTIPSRRAHFEVTRCIEEGLCPIPATDPAFFAAIAIDTFDLDRQGILRVVGAAMHPQENFAVKAIGVLGSITPSLLKQYEGYLRALFDVHLDRREGRGILLTPAIEAFFESIPLFPSRNRAPGLLDYQAPDWHEEVADFLRGDGALEDPAFPQLLSILERFRPLHDQAFDRIRAGKAPSPEAAERIANEYPPALVPLLQHRDEAVRHGADIVARARLARLPLPSDTDEVVRWNSRRALVDNLSPVDRELVQITLDENRLDLIPVSLADRAAAAIRDLYARGEMGRLDLTLDAHQFLVFVAGCSSSEALRTTHLWHLAQRIKQIDYRPQVLASVLRHEGITEELLHNILSEIIANSKQAINQARVLALPFFPHERPAFRQVMIEGYRRTIGDPHLVSAVFLAAPPEDVGEAVEFLLANHSLSVTNYVKRWIQEHPEAEGRVRLTPRLRARLAGDSDPSVRAVGYALDRLLEPESAVAS